MKVVLDTNVLVSAFLWQGTPEEVFLFGKKKKIIICANKEILQEFERVLSYPKFKERLAQIGKTPSHIIDEFAEVVDFYPSRGFPKPQITADPTDDIFLACVGCQGFFYYLWR